MKKVIVIALVLIILGIAYVSFLYRAGRQASSGEYQDFPPPELTQGIYGKVLAFRGDFMPPTTNRPFPASSMDIVAYSPPFSNDSSFFGPFKTLSKLPVATTRTDAQGRFYLNLPIGEYSVMMRDGVDVFCFESTKGDDGKYRPCYAKVTEKDKVKMLLDDIRAATF